MKKETNRIDELHRKELLKFLLVKTAAVRQGIKPAELLRVRHCYSTVTPGHAKNTSFMRETYFPQIARNGALSNQPTARVRFEALFSLS